jgi:hypothetical protein
MALGKLVVDLSEVVTFADGTKTLFSLPSGATPLLALVVVTTAFNDSGTDTLEIGVSGNTDYYAVGIPLGSTGAQLVALTNVLSLSRKTAIVAKYTGGSGDATAGRAEVHILYSNPFKPV